MSKKLVYSGGDDDLCVRSPPQYVAESDSSLHLYITFLCVRGGAVRQETWLAGVRCEYSNAKKHFILGHNVCSQTQVNVLYCTIIRHDLQNEVTFKKPVEDEEDPEDEHARFLMTRHANQRFSQFKRGKLLL